MADSFIRNFRNILEGPTSVINGTSGAAKDIATQAAKNDDVDALSWFPFALAVRKRGGSKPYTPVWGFEQDKSRYGDIDPTDGEATQSLRWRDYTVSSKGDDSPSKSFSIGYDKDGRISGVSSKGSDGEYHTYYGRDMLKNFFSQFDRDATKYVVREERTYDNGDGTLSGEASVIFDSDDNDEPFIPSMIFKYTPIPMRPQQPIRPLQPLQPRPFFSNYRDAIIDRIHNDGTTH